MSAIETLLQRNHISALHRKTRGWGSFLVSIFHRLTLLAAFLGVPLGAFAPSAFAQGGPPAMPVSISAPIAKRVTQWDEYSGRFEAVATVDIRARVSGFIDQLHFKDGQFVNSGEPLFTIDKRP